MSKKLLALSDTVSGLASQKRLLPRFAKVSKYANGQNAQKDNIKSFDLAERQLNDGMPGRPDLSPNPRLSDEPDDEPEHLHNENLIPGPSSLEKEQMRMRRRLMEQQKRESPREDKTLLTWAAMDQIRQLHESDPKLWTPQKISQSFPISEQGAMRFLRSKKPTNFTPEQIREHDEAVEKRWRQILNDDSTSTNSEEDVTDHTRLMIKTGLTKAMPLKSFTKQQKCEAEPEQAEIKIDYFDNPNDGPFTKMYKSHMRVKEALKMPEGNDNMREFDDTTIDWNKKPNELLNSVLYSDFFGQSPKSEDDKDQTTARPMRIDEFKAELKARMKESRNRFDRRFRKWSNE